MKKMRLFLTGLMLLVSVSAFAQNVRVSGTVSDASGAPLPGASVIVNGTTTGVSTGVDGKYSLTAPSEGSLVVSFIGYKDVIVSVNGRSTIDFTLEEDNTYLDEVTVVAFSTKRKQDLVGSVSTVKTDILKNTQATSVSSALEGAVAGVQVITSSGQPGSDAKIYVRGSGSLSATNSALIIVDGTPFNGNFSDLNPNDIESITVSKDAVSNSLYGSRAADGVVLVTTKTGVKEKIAINFTATAGVVSRAYKDYNMVTDQEDFYKLTWYGLRNTAWAGGKSLEEAGQYASDNLLNEVGNYNAFIIPEGSYLVNPDGSFNSSAKERYNDSFYNAMFNSSSRQEYNLSARGSNDKSDYYMSIGYLDNDSYIVGSGYNRITARANINSQLKKWLKVGVNIGFARTDQKGVNESNTAASNPFTTARSWAPIYPVHAYDAKGNMKYNEDGTPMYDAGTGQTDGVQSRPTATNQNVICNLYEDIRQSVRNAITSRGYVEAKFLEHFTASANISYDFTSSNNVTYYTPTIGDGQSFKGRGTHGAGFSTTINSNQILAYDNVFGDYHNLSAKVGHEYYLYNGKSLEAQKINFFDPMNPELENGGAIQYAESSTSKHNIEGIFAMADYNYNSKYYLSAAFRRDGTSRFLNRWGNFWSVGGAWRISQENFMQGASNIINDLKFRASYGTQGREALFSVYTPYQDLYDVTWDGSALGYSYSFYGNPNLTWEKQKTFDVGIDFKFFDRFYGSVDYFTRMTDDMIFQRPMPTSTGRPYNWENIGAMSSNGIEFDVNVDVIKKRDFRWTIGFIGASYDNEILTLPEENKENGLTSGRFKYMEGKNRYEYFTYMYAGMDENGNATWYKDEKDEEGNVTGQTTTSTYSEATKYYIGKKAQAKLNGGINTQLAWKGLDLSISTAYQIGGWAYDSEYLDGMSNSFYVGHNADMWDTYNPETGKGLYPIWNANNNSNSYGQTSDAHLVTASYFSIKNITLGYSLPQNWVKKIGIQSLRIYATGENLALWSARQGFDPRISFTGSNSDYSGYSPLKVISGGINISF